MSILGFVDMADPNVTSEGTKYGCHGYHSNHMVPEPTDIEMPITQKVSILLQQIKCLY